MRRREFALASLGSVVAGLAAAQSAGPGPAITWPDISLLGGGVLSTHSWRGQAAVVVFWATYCPYCKRHNAHVDKLYRATERQALRVLGMALDDDVASVRRYMADNEYSFPVAMDGGMLSQRLSQRRVIPMTCVLDRQGRLIQSIPGEMLEEDVLGLVSLLQRPAVEAGPQAMRSKRQDW